MSYMLLEKKFLNILKKIKLESGSMSKKTSQKRIVIDEYNKILDFMSTISPSIIDYMEKNPDYEYKLYTKYITHSDVISKGKRNEKRCFNI